MKTTTQALLALGFVSAMAFSTPSSTKAQEIGFYGPGVGIEITTRPWNQRHPRYNRNYGGNSYAYQYSRGPGGRYHTWNGCPSMYTIQDGVCKPYRGY